MPYTAIGKSEGNTKLKRVIGQGPRFLFSIGDVPAAAISALTGTV